MTILSLQLGHNATAALLKDGRVVGAVSEEKFDNIKNSSAFPEQAIQWLLKTQGLQTVDEIAIAGIFIIPHQIGELSTQPRSTFKTWILYHLLKWPIFQKLYWFVTMRKRTYASKRGRKSLQETLARIVQEPEEIIEKKLSFVEHHVCHSASVAYGMSSPRTKKTLVMTLDGSGDFYCATVNIFENGNLKRLASTPWLHSLGYLYAKTTQYLGMKALEHEYKVMGLAPYPKRQYVEKLFSEVFQPLICLDPKNPLQFRSQFPLNYVLPYLQEKLSLQRFDNVAAALQMLTEELVTAWIRKAVEITGIPHLACSGGVFMNVKLNKKIMEMPEILSCAFMPSAGDESNPFGAAFSRYLEKTGSVPQSLQNLYLGPEYNEQEIEIFLEKHRILKRFQLRKEEKIEEVIAHLLKDFQVVARFSGRAEWGARALGNRSILANPSDLKSFYEVNDAIKQRDFWMPFAPSILETYAEKYVINPKQFEAPHMALAFDSTPLARKHLRAALHQADFTLRPQIVRKEENPSYYDLLKTFSELTGIGGVMNTSLNLHGYPLVATLEQALFTLENSGLQYLAIGHYLISK